MPARRSKVRLSKRPKQRKRTRSQPGRVSNPSLRRSPKRRPSPRFRSTAVGSSEIFVGKERDGERDVFWDVVDTKSDEYAKYNAWNYDWMTLDPPKPNSFYTVKKCTPTQVTCFRCSEPYIRELSERVKAEFDQTHIRIRKLLRGFIIFSTDPRLPTDVLAGVLQEMSWMKPILPFHVTRQTVTWYKYADATLADYGVTPSRSRRPVYTPLYTLTRRVINGDHTITRNWTERLDDWKDERVRDTKDEVQIDAWKDYIKGLVGVSDNCESLEKGLKLILQNDHPLIRVECRYYNPILGEFEVSVFSGDMNAPDAPSGASASSGTDASDPSLVSAMKALRFESPN